MKKNMLRLVTEVDAETGEVRAQDRKYYESSLNEEGYKVPGHKSGAKIFGDVSFPAAMTHSEIGKMTVLAKNMIPVSNMLGYRLRSSILPYTEKHIVKLVELSPKRGKQFLQKMMDIGVMQRVTRSYNEEEHTEYYINPAYFFAGKRINLNLYLMFREALDPILPVWVKTEFLRMAKAMSSKIGS